MASETTLLALYALPLALIWAAFSGYRQLAERRVLAVHQRKADTLGAESPRLRGAQGQF